MIKETDALKVFEINMERTNMLIQAVDKIDGYNHLYQDKAYDESYDYGNIVKSIQYEELEKISISCHEHAIISLATVFESYLNELVQELLYRNGDYFLRQNSALQENLEKLITDTEIYDFEIILNTLRLKNRIHILNFLKDHNIILLNADQLNLIKSIYIRRNNFVHNGSSLSFKAKKQIEALNKVDEKKYIELSIKRIRTKFKNMMVKVHNNAIEHIDC